MVTQFLRAVPEKGVCPCDLKLHFLIDCWGQKAKVPSIMDEVARKKTEVSETEEDWAELRDGSFRNVLQRPMNVYTPPIDWDWQRTPETTFSLTVLLGLPLKKIK